MTDIEYHRSRYDAPKRKGLFGVPPGVLLVSVLVVSILFSILAIYFINATFKLKEINYSDESVDVELIEPIPPPPPPPPPQYEAREFIVYFPFDQSVLTPEAQSVVTEAAKYSNDGHATKIVVVGHTDTSGSPKYNVKLSERRAKAVADALVSQGVPAAVLGVDWKGESAPAVATGDGVKEPLNRRSTISINF